MRDDDTGHPKLALGTDDKLIDDGGGHRVEAGRGFVIQNVARPKRDGARDPDPFSHASRKFGRKSILRAGQINQGQALAHPLLNGVPVHPSPPEPEPKVVGHRHRIKQRGKLKDKTDITSQRHQFFARKLVHHPLIHDHMPAIGSQQAADKLECQLLPSRSNPGSRWFPDRE